ncbi:MAG: hypothetical protein ATN35_03875 [Epulopiscium sp. Nele67-Bin004]|nr:MAG: hypothetical protein ATN35_03875 [Epulopiscium sp. Nele67-Bin004]
MEKQINNDDSIITNPPRKIEIIDDIVYMSPSPNLRHSNIMWVINAFFKMHFRGKKCESYQVPNIYYNPDKPKDHVIPDIAIMCEPDKFKFSGYYGVPSLIVEVLSSNRRDDLFVKLELYERIGVGEYWIVDPLSNTINQYVLVEGKYDLVQVYCYLLEEELEQLNEDEREQHRTFINSSIFTGLKIDLVDIFEDTLNMLK